MRKEEAAKFLGISTRTLELYTQQGRIGGHYEKGKTRPVLVYEQEEVKRLKAELAGQSYTHRSIVERAVIDAGHAPSSNGDATRFNTPRSHDASFGLQPTSEGNGTSLALTSPMPPQMEQLLSALAALSTARAPSTQAEVPIQHKLFLTLNEAQALTVLSRGVLREAIKANELQAKIIGRGWRIRRSDMDAFAQNMSMASEAPNRNPA